MKETVLYLKDYRNPSAFDYAALDRRAEERLRCANRCRRITAAAEALTTVLIGIGFAVCTVLVFTML